MRLKRRDLCSHLPIPESSGTGSIPSGPEGSNTGTAGPAGFVVSGKGRLIVQSWRASHWKAKDIDSTLILTFWPEGGGARIELIHANVADRDFTGVSEGWQVYYFAPWQEYLKKRAAERKGKSKPRR